VLIYTWPVIRAPAAFSVLSVKVIVAWPPAGMTTGFDSGACASIVFSSGSPVVLV